MSYAHALIKLKYSASALFVLWLFALLLPPSNAHAKTPKNLYMEAQACQRELMNNPARMKYRDRWMVCIRKFKRVYAADPSGPWAAAGMYATAEMYLKLSHYSGLSADKSEGVDLLLRITKRFPESAYCVKAKTHLSKMPKSTLGKKRKAAPDKQEKIAKLKTKNSLKEKTKADSKKTVDKSDESLPVKTPSVSKKKQGKATVAVKTRPQPALSTAGKTAKSDVTPPKKQVAAKPPATSNAQEKTPQQSQNACAQPVTQTAVANPTDNTVTNLRYWSNPSYTRVVIDALGEPTYTHNILRKNPDRNKPQRLFVDLEDTHVADTLKTSVPIEDDLLNGVRTAQYKPDTVRVVLDIKSFESYKIFSLRNPYRVVIDIRGKKSSKNKLASKPKDNLPVKRPTHYKNKIPPGALVQQFALGVRRIVVDPGHGGRDYGAPGYLKGVHEKQIVLAMAKKLAKKLRQQTPCEVFLTRSDDRFLDLTERTAIANTKEADLFISVHTNAHRSKRAYGIETYYLNLATDEESIRVAARENATSERNISDLDSILKDLMQNAKVNESHRLATSVQSSMANQLKKRYDRVRDKGVKQAPFYVLLGADMPSILVETGFISNKRECKRLIDPKYQDAICDSIVKGIKKYVKDLAPTMTEAPSNWSNPTG